MKSIKQINAEYHGNLYSRAKLFEKGSWLEESDDVLLDIVQKYIEDKKDVRILDLGCGVGRNSIPIAKMIQNNGGQLVCVDFLAIAIEKLKKNAIQHGVSDIIQSHIADIELFNIEPKTFDIIIAQSVIEHGVENKENFLKVIHSIQNGTKNGGINYLGITTGLEEIDAKTNEQLRADIGYSATYEEMQRCIRDLYNHWEITCEEKEPYREEYIKNGKMIIWKATFFVFAAKK